MQQLTRTVARNSAFQLAAQIATKVLSFIFSVLIVRNLGVEAFGQYSGVVAFGMVFVFLADLGMATYSIRAIARWRDAPEGHEQIAALCGDVLGLRLTLALITALVIIAAAIITGRPWIMVGAIALSSVSLFFYAVQTASGVALAGFERFDVGASATVLNQLLYVILGAFALWVGWGYYGLIIASLTSLAVVTIIYLRSMRTLGIRIGRIRLGGWLPLLRASLPFGLITLALGLSYKFDSFLLSLTRGDAETGYYNVAYNLVFSAVVLSNVINTSLYPSLSRAAANGSKLTNVYERALRYLVLASAPIPVGIAVLADQIVPLLYKTVYAPAVPALQIVIWVVPLMYVSEFLGYVIAIGGNEKLVARSVMISTSVNVLLNLVLVPRYGFIAAAIMTVITETVLVAQYGWLLRPQLRQMKLGRLLGPVLAAFLMGVVIFLLRDLPLLINVAIGAAVYSGMLIACRTIGLEEWRWLTSFRQRPVAQVSE